MVGQGHQFTLADQTPYFVGVDFSVLDLVGWHVFPLNFRPK
jgi:hypothetical protein